MNDDCQKINIKLEGIHKAHILRIFMPAAPKSVSLDGKMLTAAHWRFDEKINKLIIKTDEYKNGDYVIER